MSKYVVEKGFAFTADGIVYAEGDEISVEVFGGNKEAFSAAIAKGMIVSVVGGKNVDAEDDKTPPDGNGGEDKSNSKKRLGGLSKKELEELAAKLKIETGGKKKDEIAALVKAAVADFVKGVDAATDEQVKEFALLVGVEVDGKTKNKIVSALNDFHG